MVMPPTVQHITAQDQWVSVPQGSLRVRVWSPPARHSQVPIILLHDSLGSIVLWRDFPAALCAATGRQVIAYDRLGFGQSSPHWGKLPLDFVLQEAEGSFAAVRQQLGVGRFVLFGHSVGGGMAVGCAARFPEACEALITESAQAFVEDRTIQGLEQAKVFFGDAEQMARLHKYHGDKAAWVLDAWIGSWLHPAFADWSLAPALPLVACPVLAIHGVDDEYGSPRHPQQIVQQVVGPAQLALMPETQHVPHRERPAQVLALVADFLREPLDGRGAGR